MAQVKGAAAAQNAAKDDAPVEDQALGQTIPPVDQAPPTEQPIESDEVVVIVEPRRSVSDGENKHGPGAKITVTAAEAKRLEAKGFVKLQVVTEKADQ